MKANLYLYDGPVKQFDRIIAEHWQQFTTASTEKQARVNLAYQYKRQSKRDKGLQDCRRSSGTPSLYGKTCSFEITKPNPSR